MIRSYRFAILVAISSCAVIGGALHAAPFASNVVLSGNDVLFVLNEPADTLMYRVNNGPFQSLDGSTKGTKMFSLGAATDKFAIVVGKTDSIGYTIPTGGSIAAAANGLSQPTNEGGFRLISNDSNPLVRFNSPRGVTVNNDPNAGAIFGTSYIANSAAGNTTGVVRAVGDGLYAIKADQSDAFGYGNTAQSGIAVWTSSASTSAPFRVAVGEDNNVYIADFSDSTGTVWRMSDTLTTPTQVLQGIGGPATLPAGQNHGSTTAVWAEGSTADGNLVLYTVDEDLRSSQFAGGAATADRNSLWRYEIGAGALPSNVTPTKVNTTQVLVELATSDMQRGADGKWYLAQNRAAGNETGLVVLDPNGVKLYDSLTDSRALLANPTAADIFRNVQGMAVSEDQKWLAVMVNNSDVAVLPLINGIPDLANRLLVNTGTDINSGRDIAFDAAGNIHYVSSGQAMYRVLSPGGTTWAATRSNGSNNSFSISSTPIPEPTSAVLVVLGLIGVLFMGRRGR